MSDKTLETIGTVHTEKMCRDAVHIAVIQCVAGGGLHAGDHVSIVNGVAGKIGKPLGIVDPYLPEGSIVGKGNMFWVHLYPNTITSLRHEWTHPDLDKPTPNKEESEKWLREFCKNSDCPPYEDTILAAIGVNSMKDRSDMGYPGYYDVRNDGEYLHFGGRDASGEIPPEFWDHVEIVTGKRIKKRAKYFSCSC